MSVSDGLPGPLCTDASIVPYMSKSPPSNSGQKSEVKCKAPRAKDGYFPLQKMSFFKSEKLPIEKNDQCTTKLVWKLTLFQLY